MPYRLTREARADLDEIWSYIFSESSSEAAADRVLDSIGEGFDTLVDWPRLGRRRDDLRRGDRSYTASNYLIFYRISRRTVVILRVLHGRRDIRALFRGS